MKFKMIIFFCITVLISTHQGTAQLAENPKLLIGINGGGFRISVNDYPEFYGNPYAVPLGGMIGYAFSPSFHLMVKGKLFQKSKTGYDEKSQENEKRVWQQSWFELGIQRYSTAFIGDTRSYLGFGLAFFFIEEKEDGDFLMSKGYDGDRVQPKGFYLCVGFDHYMTDRITVGFEIELTSAGVGKGTGLESQSVGGIYAGLGINCLLF